MRLLPQRRSAPPADCRCRRHFDTAEVYKSGALAFGGKTAEAPPGPIVYNESQLGKFFATVRSQRWPRLTTSKRLTVLVQVPRDSFTVASKFMPLGKPDSSYETVKAALTASLERLGLEYVDLYYSHRVLSREQGIEYATAARRLPEEGLIKHIGLSEVSALDLRAAHAVAPVCAIRARTSFPYCPVPPA